MLCNDLEPSLIMNLIICHHLQLTSIMVRLISALSSRWSCSSKQDLRMSATAQQCRQNEMINPERSLCYFDFTKDVIRKNMQLYNLC